MSQPFFSPLAVQDLDGILEYIARDKPLAAITFVETLKEKCRTLARFPLLGASREGVVSGLRMFPVGNYVIYYRPENDTVRIERVLHGARDADSLFR
jgi:plasmid stabilization system protein ParE